MMIQVEDSRTGKLIKLDVKEHHKIERIVDIILKHMGLLQENRSYTLVLDGKELNPQLTIEDCVHKMGLKENDKLTLWARVVGGSS